MKKLIMFLSILFFLSCFTTTVYAHPGDTDSKGGHYDTSTGKYHYHHGKPAHQHKNGECPYDRWKISIEEDFFDFGMVVVVVAWFFFCLFSGMSDRQKEYKESIIKSLFMSLKDIFPYGLISLFFVVVLAIPILWILSWLIGLFL